MKYVVGVFHSRTEAEYATDALSSRVDGEHLNFLPPEVSEDEIRAVPTVATEEPGVAKALGAVIGGALGIGIGFALGASLGLALAPGINFMTLGLATAVLLGSGGLLGGMAAGDALDECVCQGVPEDEMLLYRDALKQGRSLVVAAAENRAQADLCRHLLAQYGAERVDPARVRWWIGWPSAECNNGKQPAGAIREAESSNFRRSA